MNLSAFLTPGTITGAFSLCAAIAAAFGKPVLASWFADPATATMLQTVIAGIGGLVAGMLKGVETPAKTQG